MPTENFELFVGVLYANALRGQVANLKLPEIQQEVAETHVKFSVVILRQTQLRLFALGNRVPIAVTGKKKLDSICNVRIVF